MKTLVISLPRVPQNLTEIKRSVNNVVGAIVTSCSGNRITVLTADTVGEEVIMSAVNSVADLRMVRDADHCVA